MKTRRKVWGWSVRVGLVALAVFALAISMATPASAQSFTQLNPRPFDFNDTFYFNNGFDLSIFATFPARVGFDMRSRADCTDGVGSPATGDEDPNCVENGSVSPPGVGHWEPDFSNTDPTRSNIRVKQTTGGFDADGDLIYYHIFAPVPHQGFFDLDNPNPFLDEDGQPILRENKPLTIGQVAQETMALAENFRAFLFPMQGRDGDTRYVTEPCDPSIGPGPGVFDPGGAAYNCFLVQPPPVNRRQDNVFETTDTYSCKNVTGLWLLNFVTWTEEGLGPKAKKDRDALIAKNGTTRDGLPVLETLAEIQAFGPKAPVHPNDPPGKGWLRFTNPPPGDVTVRPGATAPRWVV